MAKKTDKFKSFHWTLFDDFILVLLFPLLASFLTVYYQLSFLLSTLLFFAVPLAFLLIRNHHLIKKALLAALVMLPATVVLDYFAIRDKSWWDSSIFSFRLLNGIPLEDFLWFVLWFTYIIIFYAYFIDKKSGSEEKISKHYKSMLTGWSLALIIFSMLYLFAEKYLYIPYFYLFFTVVLGIIPTIWVFRHHHSFAYKFSKAGVYFFAVNFLHEYSAQSAHHWIFPGNNFVGWVDMAGLRLPVEELVMWMMLGSVFALSWYEYFMDDFR